MEWLERFTILTPHLILCGTEQAYLAAVEGIGLKNPDLWLNAGFNGITHTILQDGKLSCIVCINFENCKDVDDHEICGLLVHESVHVWQSLCKSIGEDRPSIEFEAYTVQMISQRLIKSYFEQERGYATDTE